MRIREITLLTSSGPRQFQTGNLTPEQVRTLQHIIQENPGCSFGERPDPVLKTGRQSSWLICWLDAQDHLRITTIETDGCGTTTEPTPENYPQ